MTTTAITVAHAQRSAVSALVSVVVSLVAAWLLMYLQKDGKGQESDHDASMRACVERPHSGFDGVGGLVCVKDELRRAVLLPFGRPELFFRGPRVLRASRGVLLHGPPGTGKTLLARALAAEAKVAFLPLTAASLESKWWGETPKLLQAAFRLARNIQPCIVCCDELDGIGGRTRSEQDPSCVYSFKTELLRHLDAKGEEAETAAVMVLACTNHMLSLDAAVRRRFARRIHVGLPTTGERLEILLTLASDSGISKAVLRRAAKQCAGCTGADLASILSDAMVRGLDSAEGNGSGSSMTLAHWNAAVAAYRCTTEE